MTNVLRICNFFAVIKVYRRIVNIDIYRIIAILDTFIGLRLQNKRNSFSVLV